MARIAAREGRKQELDTLLIHAIALAPEAQASLELRAFRAFALGDSLEQARGIGELRRGDDLATYATAWRLSVFARDLAGAERAARLLAQPGRLTNMRASVTSS